MVQFGAEIEEQAAEWSQIVSPENYIDYKRLKQIIDECQAQEKSGAPVKADEFFTAVDEEAEKVRAFIMSVVAPKNEVCACPLGLESTVHCVVTQKVRLSEEKSTVLAKFAGLNREGFRKILKKWGKNFSHVPGSSKSDLNVRLQVIYSSLKEPISTLERLLLECSQPAPISTGSKEKRVLIGIVIAMLITVLVLSLSQPRMVAAFGIGLMFSFLLAIANGANDICNSVGTSVGAGAITMRQAVVWGSIFEFLGAMTMGQFVSKEISKGILESSDYIGEDMDLFALCMVSVLVGASLTTLLATFYGFPISATHGIIGGLVSVGMAAQGAGSVGWEPLAKMVVGWVLSPMLAMTVSASLYLLINKAVITKKDPFAAGKRWQPIFLWMTISVCSLFLIIKGPKAVKEIWLWAGVWFAFLIAFAFGGAMTLLYVGYQKRKRKANPDSGSSGKEDTTITQKDVEVALTAGDNGNGNGKGPNGSKNENGGAANSVVPSSSDLHDSDDDSDHENEDEDEDDEKSADPDGPLAKMEELFTPLLVISALCVAFAHGANDVGNAVGPLSVVVQIYVDGNIPADGKPDIPIWALFMGSVGFVIGIVFLGSKTIATVGTKITKLTPTRSYATQIGAALAVLASSVIGLPVSTSHCLVGSVVGVGLVQTCQGVKGALSLKMLRKIALGWVVTIPLAMLVAVLVFLPFKHLFQGKSGLPLNTTAV